MVGYRPSRYDPHFRALADASLDIITICDEALAIVYANAFEDHVVGTWAPAFAPPEYQAEIEARLRRVLATGNPERWESPAIGETERWFEVVASKMEIADDAPTVLLIARDVTQRKRAEAEKEAMAAQLRQAQKLEALGRLAGGISHDFNNLVTVMQCSLDLARDQASRGVSNLGELARLAEVIERARRLTGQLLMFARRGPPRVARNDLRSVVAEGVDMFRAIVPPTIELEAEPESSHATSDPPAWVMGDRTQLGQVVMNLLINARDALEGRGRIAASVHVHPEGPPPCIRLEGPAVELRVDDDGPGIPAADAERIFEPFYSTKAPGEGTGLGLAVVHGIVTAHGGVVTFDDAELGGARLSVWLPLVDGGS